MMKVNDLHDYQRLLDKINLTVGRIYVCDYFLYILKDPDFYQSIKLTKIPASGAFLVVARPTYMKPWAYVKVLYKDVVGYVALGPLDMIDTINANIVTSDA